MPKSILKRARASCPCCGYPTLPQRGAYDICILCWWEDDGQDDRNADLVRGGPNGDVSLTEARANFRDHMTMYRSGEDTRIGGGDSPLAQVAKRKIIESFEVLRTGISDADTGRAWAIIEENESVLEAETDRKIREYESAIERGGGTA